MRIIENSIRTEKRCSDAGKVTVRIIEETVEKETDVVKKRRDENNREN